MLKVENLRKVFRTEEIETIALNGVSFEVNEGEFVAIMGPSGCGKSTLLNILGLLDNPTSGSYQLLGREVATLREKDRTRFRKGNIGFVFQSFNLIDELNVFENVELPLIYLRVKAAERKRRVNEILSRMNISHRAEHRKPRLEERPRGNGDALGAEPRRHDGHHGDPLAARLDLCAPGAAPVRRRAGAGPDQPTLMRAGGWDRRSVK